MTKLTLTMLDTSGIQNYIFSSNRLQENIGASELVYRATTLWAFDVLESKDDRGLARFRHNILDPSSFDWSYDESFQIENQPDENAVEVIQAAGGNTLLLFRNRDLSREFVQRLTLRVLKEAPGLTLLAQHFDNLEFDVQRLTEARKILFEEKMRPHKLSLFYSAPLLGLGVTAQCSSTGLPAVRTPEGAQKIGQDEFSLLVPGQDEQEAEQNRLISRQTTFKLAARDLANLRLNHIVGEVAQWYEFPFDIDNLGRISGEESYVAVVHADGNRIGEHVGEVVDGVQQLFGGRSISNFNREYIKASRGFSKKIEAASRKTLIYIVEKLVASIDSNGMVAGRVPVVSQRKHTYIPFRPLVFGGDDVTFLCNGQLGVELATKYLEAFKKFTADEGLKDLYACAGVSIVKMHYPFSRAYQLAEELTHNAKQLVRKLFPENKLYALGEQRDCSALDWHFAQSGLSGSLKVIRRREYRSDDDKPLHLRPVTLNTINGAPSWQGLKSVITKFQDEEKWSRNKVIGLREPLRKGAAEVKDYRLNFRLAPLPEFAGEEAQSTGWMGATCYYFDAIELLDHHVSLDHEAEKEGAE